MYLLLGKSLMESTDYQGAVQSFVRARTGLRHHTSRALSVVSLVSANAYAISKLPTMFDRYLDGNLMILTS